MDNNSEVVVRGKRPTRIWSSVVKAHRLTKCTYELLLLMTVASQCTTCSESAVFTRLLKNK